MPFRLLTREQTTTLGGYSTRRCRWWSSPHLDERRPEIAADRRENLAQGAIGAPRRKTCRRYLVTKHPSRNMAGGDLGVARFLTMSESTAQQGRSTKQEPQEPLWRKPHRPLIPVLQDGGMSK